MLNMDSDKPLKKTSQGVIELGLRYAREDGICIHPGDTVPMGWLTANHGTGRSDVPVAEIMRVNRSSAAAENGHVSSTTSTRRDRPNEQPPATATRRDAEAAYIAALSDIVNIRTLSGGRDGYDFYARVPGPELHETTQRIVDLECEIREKYGVHFRTYAIPTAR